MSTKPDSSQIKFDNGTAQDVLDTITGSSGAAAIGYTPAATGLIATYMQTCGLRGWASFWGRHKIVQKLIHHPKYPLSFKLYAL